MKNVKKIKKYLSWKVIVFLSSVFSLFIGFYFLLCDSKKNTHRKPAAYTIYGPEVKSRSKQMIEEGRRLHVIEDYKSANKTLAELLDKYPYAGYLEEASFLLAKGLYYEQDYIRSEEVIDTLLEYNPISNSKWVGYSLLILGKIHEARGEKDDSMDLYRKVITEFSDPELVNEAEDLLMSVSL